MTSSIAGAFGRNDGALGKVLRSVAPAEWGRGETLAGPGVGGREGGLLAAEEFDSESSEEEAADVRHIGDASVLDVGYGAYVEELDEEPEADEQDGGDIRDADEEEEEEERTDAVAGIGDEEGSHDGGDGAAGSEGGNVGAGRGGDLGKHRDQASEDIEDGEAEGVHGVFHRGTEGPEEDHVAEDVRPASMEKHGGEQGDEAVAGADVSRDGGPLVDEGVAALEFEEPDKNVEDDDDDGGDGKVDPAPRYVS
jgi:hypothetical protein